MQNGKKFQKRIKIGTPKQIRILKATVMITTKNFNPPPPRNAKVVKIEDTNIKTRLKNEELYDEIAKRLLKFSNRKSFPLESQYKRACRMVASKRAKLSKGNVKDIVNELKLNEEDTAFVFKKVYCKLVNVYATVKF